MALDRSALNAKIQYAARLDPAWWMETVLGVKLWLMQKMIAAAVAKYPRVSVRSCEGSGKSFIAACIALWFLYNFVPSTVITTAPTFRQVAEILWREVSQRYHGSRMELGGNLTTTSLDLADNHFAIGFATDEPERFQGFHNLNVLVIGDEASGLTEKCYQAFENPLATGFTRLLTIGNPTQSVGGFRDSFVSKLYKTFHISAFETPNFASFGITQEDIASGKWEEKLVGQELPCPYLVAPRRVSERYDEWGFGSFLYQTYILGQFPQAGVNNLFPLNLIEAAMTRVPQRDLKAVKLAALDISRYGDDETVFGIKQGDRILPMQGWHHQDTVYTAGRTSRLIKEVEPATTRVDVVGIGSGVFDSLRDTGHKVEEFNAGAKALDVELFLNKRAENYWKLYKSLLDETLTLPNDPRLKSQLADIRYSYKANGQLRIESKEEARSRGSRSPDRGDVAMMLEEPVPIKSEKPKSKSHL